MTNPQENLWYWRARLDNHRSVNSPIIDGDTIDLVIDTGFYQQTRIRLRLERTDTAELRGVPKDSPEYQEAVRQKEFVTGWLKNTSERWPFVVKTKMSRGKYGRWIGNIWRVSDNHNLVDDLHSWFPEVKS